MNRITISSIAFFLTICVIIPSAKAVTEKRVPSKIKNVNVFLSRAQVKREAKVSIPAGKTDVILTGLTTKLDVNSIQVNGTGKFILMSVKHQNDYLNKNQSSDKAKGIQARIDGLKTSNRKLNAELQVLNEERDLLLKNRSIGGSDNGVSALELEKITTYYRKRRMEISSKIIEVSSLIDKNNKSNRDLRNELREINRNANVASSNIVVSVSSKVAQSITLRFDYIVLNAGWIPYYDIRATEGKDKVQLSYKAQIYQSTDIDWNNVNISVSTGNPSQGGNKPNLNAWYLNLSNGRNQLYENSTGLAYEEISDDFESYDDSDDSWGDEGGEEDEWEEEPVAERTSSFTAVSESNLATTFDIALKQTIPSDNKKYTVDIQQLDIASSFQHSAVPKLDPDAFLLANLTNWENYNLLSGSANVFYNGSFVGNSAINMSNTTDTLPISLGRDKKVIITREKIKDFCKTKTIGTNVKKTVGYEITVKNAKKEAITLELEDHYPISSNNNAEVTVLEKSGAKDKGQGKLIWQMELKPGESKKIELKFEVKYNKKYTVSNL